MPSAAERNTFQQDFSTQSVSSRFVSIACIVWCGLSDDWQLACPSLCVICSWATRGVSSDIWGCHHRLHPQGHRSLQYTGETGSVSISHETIHKKTHTGRFIDMNKDVCSSTDKGHSLTGFMPALGSCQLLFTRFFKQNKMVHSPLKCQRHGWSSLDKNTCRFSV
jgi:hypothetical protein